MTQVRYVGPHTEGVDILPITGGPSFFDIKPGDVVDVPDELAHGRAPEVVKDEDGNVVNVADSGVEGLLATDHWELADTSTTAAPPAVKPASEITTEDQS